TRWEQFSDVIPITFEYEPDYRRLPLLTPQSLHAKRKFAAIAKAEEAHEGADFDCLGHGSWNHIDVVSSITGCAELLTPDGVSLLGVSLCPAGAECFWTKVQTRRLHIRHQARDQRGKERPQRQPE